MRDRWSFGLVASNGLELRRRRIEGKLKEEKGVWVLKLSTICIHTVSFRLRIYMSIYFDGI